MSHHRIRFTTNVITTFILILFIVYLIVEWKNVPDTVPTHFTIAGQVDRYGNKTALLIIPLLAVIISIVLAIIECFPQIWNYPVRVTEENMARLVKDGVILAGMLKIWMALLFSYIGFCTINGMSMSCPMYVLIGALIILITIGLLKMIKDR